MFDGVKPQYWSCNGETVLKKTQYNEDVANHRALQRVNTDLLAQFGKQVQRAETPPPPPGFLAGAVRAVSQFIQQLARPVMQAFTMLAAIPQAVATVFANLGQGVANAGQLAEKAVAGILTFFFGHKKDKTEEKEKRDKADFKQSDFFDDTKVKEGENASMGSGQ